jgi:GT2 family glycosyltransferase
MTHAAPAELTISPILPASEPPVWGGAVWIGEIWADVVDIAIEHAARQPTPARCRLEGSVGFGRARVLIRAADAPLGYAELGIADGSVSLDELWCRVEDLRRSAASAPPASGAGDCARSKSLSVVICTRDRPEMLRGALESVQALDYPDLNIIVVDNAAETDATRDYVVGLSDRRIRLIAEPRPGLSKARNAGLLNATGELVAFTDDDVLVDQSWLSKILDGFSRGRAVACVTGVVLAAELRTPSQVYFDRLVGWSEITRARVFDSSDPPSDIPLFPFAVRNYGTGANFAVDRDVVIGLGGFDEALGAGSSTGGGEDIDMFVRILCAGGQLVHDPAAIVWHRHRVDNDGLLPQIRSYGTGLGAWLGKVAGDRTTARLAVTTGVRNVPALLRHLAARSATARPVSADAAQLPAGIGSGTWRAVLSGALAYRKARRRGLSPAPLLGIDRRGADGPILTGAELP